MGIYKRLLWLVNLSLDSLLVHNSIWNHTLFLHQLYMLKNVTEKNLKFNRTKKEC